MAVPHAEHVATALERLALTARGLANPDLPQPAVGRIDIRDTDGRVLRSVELSWAVTHALLASCRQASADILESGAKSAGRGTRK